MNKIKNGFTLAETLITLGIIGVISALVIPPLINNYQKTQYLTGLKKAYSELEQMLQMYMADEGVSELSQTALFTKNGTEEYGESTNRHQQLEQVMKKYFKIVKSCSPSQTDCGIEAKFLYFQDGGSLYEENIDYLDGSTPGSSKFFTADGKTFIIYLTTTDGSCSYWSPIGLPNEIVSGPLKGICARVSIDVNGTKPPNQLGRDFFTEFEVGLDGHLYPYGSKVVADLYNSNSYYWEVNTTFCGSPSKSLTEDYNQMMEDYGAGYIIGIGCFARILDENWQMNY